MKDVINIISSTIEQKTLNRCNSIIAAFFPGKNIEINLAKQGLLSILTLKIELKAEVSNTFEICSMKNNQVLFHRVIGSQTNRLPLPGKESLFQILLKRAIYIFLTEFTGEILPWGILSGIRPGKLILRMQEMGLQKEIQFRILTELYMVAEEKVNLLQTIAEIQRPFLRQIRGRPDLVSVFLTIPFCPSRCFYCSFPFAKLSVKNRGLFQNYLDALYQEVKLTGEMMKELGLKADSIYIGGGTPTILAATELEMLLQVILENIKMNDEVEYTVEAGRPDTTEYTKLMVLKNYRVNRLSINPQSMQEQTLNKIGRNHLVEDILKCYSLARKLSDWVINMDLIIGLPGEGLIEIENSLGKVLALQPDNLTVHALALKRGSIAWDNNYIHSSCPNWLSIQSQVAQQIKSAGLNPYYLYRQKYTVGNLENVGYALRGKECRYNMAIIEEQQNIIGLGAGATSKLLQGNSGHINIYNPIDLKHYLKGFEEVHLKRKRVLREEHGF
jgi:oxygen-independent coproporphyrinogen-3 oxidase